MTTRLRYLIGAGVGLVAGALLMVVGSGALSARGTGANASNTLVACEPSQRAVIRHAVVNGELQVATECVTSGLTTARYQDAVGVVPAVYTQEGRAVRTASTATRAAAPRRVATKSTSERSWQKTALVIGGSAGAGAGVGALVDGKKGALIGAAIGGGAAAIYEAIKRR